MNDPSHWSLDQDPPRDEPLARLLRAAEGRLPGADVDWERLHTAITGGAASASAPARGSRREWWEVVVQWRRVAAAASVAAMLTAAALLWRADGGPAELTLTEQDPPESVALARVVAAYPDEAVLASLLETARADELTAWGSR
jgi:hypothetical protein